MDQQSSSGALRSRSRAFSYEPLPGSKAVSRLLVHIAGSVVAGAGIILEWERRRGSRQALRSLGRHEIRDFCLDSMAAEREAAKPFWRA